MRMYDIIMKKRNGGELSKEEIRFFIEGYTKGEIPDYQVSALMMAIYFQKMTERETYELTMAMAHSGEMLDLSSIHGCKVDKHSTGGVGDKTSLALTPMVAACGIPVAKMSGRGLGHTGGTIDKLESFPGFSTSLTTEQFIENVNKIGIAIMGQTADLAPADKKLYALRDVTATVDNMSLIASSIMSKKLAAGADAIVLDVKTGSGAFMKSREDAFALAEEMVKIGKNAGRKTIAIISDMDQPLGRAVGNALEVKEAIATLRGEGPEDFKELCMVLGSRMLLAGSKAESVEEARNMLTNVIRDGSALRKLEQFVEAQGGDPAAVTDPELLPKASMVVPVCADRDGFVEKIACEDIGICSLLLGGGRETKESEIDLSVGILLEKKKGDAVKKGEPGVLKRAPAIIRAACDQAHALGLKVAAHVESPEGVKAALENGVDTIEHGAMPDAEMLELFRTHGASLVTTISPTLSFALFDQSVSHATDMQKYNGRIVMDGIVGCAKACLEAGIPVGLGTDTACPYVTQYGTWRELTYLRRFCGVSNTQALHIATLASARIAGVEKETGSIEAGKSADMLVCRENPLNNLAALRQLSSVIFRGKCYTPKVNPIPQVEQELDNYL